MLSSTAQRRKQIAREWSEDVESSERYVDIGVHLRIVRADPAGEVLVPGGRPMIVVGERHYGGMLDTAANPPCIPDDETGYSQNPQEWLCSEDQFHIIEHADSVPIGKLALGGMGAGKTTGGVMWVYLRWLENLGTRKEGGITAPTEKRLELVLNELFDKFPPQWRTFNSEKGIITLADGFRVRAVSTHRQSQKQGSRIQGFNWVFWLGDEMQDQLGEFVHIQARLRSKADGRAKRLATATAKDDPRWRTLKDELIDSGLWTQHPMLGPNSPFIHPDHWAAMRKVTTERDFRRLVLAEDLPPESRLYNTFDRKENVRPIPLGARKVTSVVLHEKTNARHYHLLIGHDPGSAKAASVFLDAYTLRGHGEELYWWVRGEHFTLYKTAEVHATEVLDIVRKQFGLNIPGRPECAHVRSQPLGGAEDKPDLSIKRIWNRVGLDMSFARYSVTNGQGCGQIKKDDRIGMVNTLFCNAEGKRRLFIECDDRGVVVAPKLLEALELMERDHLGRPERDEKDVEHDRSDLPAAMGYGLYPFEREAATALRASVRQQLGG